ncbi:hypothetical protein OsJ_12399 [Oryza sativa Japonica Group]|uniref:Uncharacterized protein n=2 Tax=Oryza sativa TaxID=4530 RepID=B9FB96_ORYSJ|nr:hypothetical protein OsJ_12399 [Oryza sativa Japonica Group]
MTATVACHDRSWISTPPAIAPVADLERRWRRRRVDREAATGAARELVAVPPKELLDRRPSRLPHPVRRRRWWAASAQLGTVAEPLQDEEAGHTGNGADPALRQPAIRRLPPPEVELDNIAHQVHPQVVGGGDSDREQGRRRGGMAGDGKAAVQTEMTVRLGGTAHQVLDRTARHGVTPFSDELLDVGSDLLHPQRPAA